MVNPVTCHLFCQVNKIQKNSVLSVEWGTKKLLKMDIDVSSKKSMSTQPWVEKYRPKSLDDIVAHQDIISIISNLIDNDNLPHLLLYGPPGMFRIAS